MAKNLLKDSWPLIFTSFSGILFMYADRYLLSFSLILKSYYAAAVQLVINVIPSVLSNMIYPMVIKFME